MLKVLLSSKIHRAAVTDASLEYEGSLAIDANLLQACGMAEYERILVGNLNNGERFETYAIQAPAGSGTISLNGATAHLGKIGDRLTIMSFCHLTPAEVATHQPSVILLDEKNHILQRKGP
ncbi:MAG: aspartate 1-decarboxylase [Candidatus Methylacidiphilales bacterium]|nr:aspartate 1-decarboxylase [Candidatus Methylacidiphilales bacterium]